MLEPSLASTVDVVERDLSEERRASLRHRSARQTSLRTTSPPCDAVWSARIRDLSTLGVGLVFPHEIEVGALLEIHLSQTTGGAAHDVLARVVHVEPELSGAWLVGCAFVSELDDARLQRLDAQRIRTAAGDPRRWVRFPCNVETVCTTCQSASGEQSPARILNVSPGGVGLLTPCEFDVGMLLDLDMPTGVAEPEKLRVRVVRVVPHGYGNWFLGCEFVDRLTDAEVRACL